MHFGGADGQADADAAVAAVGTFWGLVDNMMDSESSWATEAEVAVIAPATGSITGFLSTTPESGDGLDVEDALPTATQGLVRWTTNTVFQGRRIRGRTFIPSLVESSNDNGRVLAATVSGLNTAAAGLISDVNSTFQIYSRTHFLAGTVLTGSTWPEFAVLRSRRD